MCSEKLILQAVLQICFNTNKQWQDGSNEDVLIKALQIQFAMVKIST